MASTPRTTTDIGRIARWASGYPSRLYRYSYNASTDTYTKDSGFPVTINNYRLETLVIDKDSTGTLWATWTQGDLVYVNHTVGGDDAAWEYSLINPPDRAPSDLDSGQGADAGPWLGWPLAQ